MQVVLAVVHDQRTLAGKRLPAEETKKERKKERQTERKKKVSHQERREISFNRTHVQDGIRVRGTVKRRQKLARNDGCIARREHWSPLAASTAVQLPQCRDLRLERTKDKIKERKKKESERKRKERKKKKKKKRKKRETKRKERKQEKTRK